MLAVFVPTDKYRSIASNGATRRTAPPARDDRQRV